MNNDDLLTPDQLCEWLQVPKSWLYMRTMEKGTDSLPRLKIGKFLRFEKPAVEAWLKRQRKEGYDDVRL